MISSADFQEALNRVWDENGLNAEFMATWLESDKNEFPVLHDQEACPSQPFPYCVYSQETVNTITRMTGSTSSSRREERDIPLNFHIHAKGTDDVDAKELAANLAEKVIAIFGGHPDTVPKDLMLENGSFLQSQYQNDYSVRTGDEEYQWVVSYVFKVDVPVAA